MYEYDSDPWTWREYLTYFFWVVVPSAITIAIIIAAVYYD